MAAEPNAEPEDEARREAAKESDQKLTYSRFAAVALPPLVVACVYLVYRDLDRLAKEPLPPQELAAIAGSPAPAKPPPAPRAPATDAAAAFEAIYAKGIWGRNEAGEGTSGSGSTLEATAPYRSFLQSFMKKHGIESVVDAGCGDWEFSSAIDWTGIDYKGYDIVPAVIAKAKEKYERPNVRFFVANIVTDELPPADLLISKHVIQHLPNADVRKFLRQLPKYRHILLTNSVHPVTLSAQNRDIEVGGFRLMDPTQPPFGLPGVKVLTWWDGWHMQQVVHLARREKTEAAAPQP